MKNLSSSSRPIEPLAVVVGVGPNLGSSIARKFASQGYRIAILARNRERISELAVDIARVYDAAMYAIDFNCTDQQSVAAAFHAVNSLGPVEVFIYNAHPPSLTSSATSLADIQLQSFQNSLDVSTVGPLLCAQQIIPQMVERRRGTILFSGCTASDGGMAGLAELCCAKAALRAFSQCLASEYQDKGIHVAHVKIGCLVAPPSPSVSSPFAVVPTMSAEPEPEVDPVPVAEQPDTNFILDPDHVAEAYWELHIQDPTSWDQEITRYG